jgi:hypothetical protein
LSRFWSRRDDVASAVEYFYRPEHPKFHESPIQDDRDNNAVTLVTAKLTDERAIEQDAVDGSSQHVMVARFIRNGRASAAESMPCQPFAPAEVLVSPMHD